MKYIKHFETYSDKFAELKKELDKYNINNYHIQDDGTIDVNDSVHICGKQITKLPFKFGKVTGSFECYQNKLTTLEGCPKEVGVDFVCSNNQLTNLVGGPEEVGRDYNCEYNKLISLEGIAAEIGNCLDCSENLLKYLDCSTNVGGDIFCYDNEIDPENSEFYGDIKGKIYYKGNGVD